MLDSRRNFPNSSNATASMHWSATGEGRGQNPSLGAARQHAAHVIRRHRETNAHLLLEGEPRVVRLFHTFKGSMLVPLEHKDPEDQQPARKMEVVGLVEELCSETSLSNFLSRLSHAQAATLWPVHHVASEFAVLMQQVGGC